MRLDYSLLFPSRLNERGRGGHSINNDKLPSAGTISEVEVGDNMGTSGDVSGISPACPQVAVPRMCSVCGKSPRVPGVPWLNEQSAEKWQESFNERAAILQYDAGLSRAIAEVLAAEQSLRVLFEASE